MVVPTTAEVEEGASDESNDDATFNVAGADLIKHAPEVAHWLASLFPDKIMVIHALVYLDGEAHVRASVAMDAITQHVVQSRGKGMTALAYLGSPATAYCIPEEARNNSLDRFANAPLWHTLVGGKKNALDPVAAVDTKGEAYNAFLQDGLIVFQVKNDMVGLCYHRWCEGTGTERRFQVRDHMPPATAIYM
jgi:hypothetical protein